MAHLTETLLKSLKPTTSRTEVSDDEVPGFRARIGPRGISFHLRYRSASGQQRNPRLGKWPALSVGAARTKARALYMEVCGGGDPSLERKKLRDSKTFAEAAEVWLLEHVDPKRKPRTAASYRALLRLHIEPAIGTTKIGDLDSADVERLHTSIGKRVGKGSANRALAVVSAVCSFSERRRWRPQRSNPCYGVERFPPGKAGHYLTAAELARLEAELARAGSAPRGSQRGDTRYVSHGAVAVIRLLLHTGCRLGEILGLTWAEVDIEHGVLDLGDSKTGRSVRPLSPPAVALLRDLKPSARIGGLVCTSETGGPVHNVQRAWRSIRARADLDHVRIHDLRHSAASTAIEAGVPIELVGAMLGHRSVLTTQRYRHIADTAKRETARRFGEAMAGKLARGKVENAAARVVALPRKRKAGAK